jgi:hypothetical protein
MMTSRPRSNPPGRRLWLGLAAVLLLLPRVARADIYAPFVWNLTFAAVVLLPVIALVEGLVLWKLRHLPARRSLGMAFLLNLASTLVGVLLSLLVGLTEPVLDPFAVAGFFLGTVGIEGWLLARFSPGLARPYALSFRLNLVSYALLAVCAGYLMHQQQRDKILRIPPSPPMIAPRPGT